MFINKPVALTLTAKLTFANGQVFTEQLNGFTPAMLDNKVWEYQNNEMIKSYVVVDEEGKKVM